MMPRYPVFVPTKGRWENPLTIQFLQRDRVPFYAVVQPREVERYRRVLEGGGELLVLPSTVSNLLGTRNWIRDYAERLGAKRHWQFDDNIGMIRRLYEGRRIPCEAGPAIRAVEDFTNRYENVGVSGMNYQMFGVPGVPAYQLNCHVYSATLVNHAMPCRWRLVYNDDTDLCLQSLASGWATILVNVFLVDKKRTMTMKGGNTDALYQGDGRMQMARALEREWPGIAKVKKRFGREQHFVDWTRFRDNPRLIRKPGIDLSEFPETDEYGLVLKTVRPVRSEKLRELVAGFRPSVELGENENGGSVYQEDSTSSQHRGGR